MAGKKDVGELICVVILQALPLSARWHPTSRVTSPSAKHYLFPTVEYQIMSYRVIERVSSENQKSMRSVGVRNAFKLADHHCSQILPWTIPKGETRNQDVC